MQTRNKEILRIALPSIVSNITVPLLGLVDTAITGHLGSAAYIGAVAIGSMLFNTIYWLFGFLRMSTSGMTSQALGRGVDTLAPLLSALRLALLIALGLMTLQLPLRWLGLWLMDPTEEIRHLTVIYFNICIWGAPAVLSLFCLNGWFIGMQNSRSPMVVAIFQNVVNILASLTFVYGLGMKIEGVALGTLVAQWSGVAVAAWMARRSSQSSQSSHSSQSSPTSQSSLSSQSSPSIKSLDLLLFLRTLCLVSVMLFFTSAGSWQGETLLAVNTLLMQMFLLVSYVMDGFANAAEAMSGKYYGAGDRKALLDTVRKSFLWGALCAAAFTVVYVLGGDAFLGLLTDEPSVIRASHDYVVWAWLVPFISFSAFIWDGIYVGLTLARQMFYATALAALVFFGLYCITDGNHGLWLAFLAFLFTRGAVQTVLFYFSHHSNWVPPSFRF